MFHTEGESAHIEKISNYTDPKGEKAPGLQISASMTLEPEALNMFAPGLRESFYRTHDVISAQNAGGGVKAGTVVRRFDLFDRIACGQKVVGADVVIGKQDLLGASQVRLPEATIDRIKVKRMKAGIEIRMRILAHPDGTGIARLFEALKGAVEITITPPEAAEFEPDDDGDEDLDDAQGDMLDDDDDQAEYEADPLASAVLSGSDEPAQSSATVTHRRRRKVDRAFPDAADGTASTAQDALAGA